MQIVSKIIVIDESGMCLVLFRSDTHPLWPGHMDFPGGEVEKNEDSRLAAARELREETGIKSNPEHLTLISKRKHDRIDKLYVLRVIDLKKLQIKLSWEHSRYELLTLSELKVQEVADSMDEYFSWAIDKINELL